MDQPGRGRVAKFLSFLCMKNYCTCRHWRVMLI